MLLEKMYSVLLVDDEPEILAAWLQSPGCLVEWTV
jgi:hypothetical protein